jgi:hypothetical protein
LLVAGRNVGGWLKLALRFIGLANRENVILALVVRDQPQTAPRTQISRVKREADCDRR